MDSHKRTKWINGGMRAFPSNDRPFRADAIAAFVIPTDEMYQAGFQRAADMVVSAAEGDGLNADDLFFPVAHLYRHHLELTLKSLVSLGVDMGALHGCETMLKEHSLEPLWGEAKDLIIQASPESPQRDREAVERVIHQFQTLDPRGQRFRYSRNAAGTPHSFSSTRKLDLVNLKSVVGAVSDYLDAAYAAVEACH